MHKYYKILFGCLLFLFSNCGNDEGPKPLHVYVAGNQFINNDNAPVYWKDGALIELPFEDNYAEATSIFVSGSDVYVSGYTYNYTTQSGRAVYWKNGQIEYLTSGDNEALGFDVFVSGKDVYVVGTEKINNIYIARYWKNGVAVNVTNGANFSFGNAISVQGSDVYVGGREFNTTTNKYIAKVWKNGTATQLTADDRQGYISSVFISGTDVYAAGREENPRKGVYWKNGVRTELSSDGWVSSVAISEGTVYASISEAQSGAYKPLYAKGSATTQLSDANGEAWDIAVFEKQVYVVGNTYSSGGVFSPKIWIDGVEETLPMTGSSCYANAVFVTRH